MQSSSILISLRRLTNFYDVFGILTIHRAYPSYAFHTCIHHEMLRHICHMQICKGFSFQFFGMYAMGCCRQNDPTVFPLTKKIALFDNRTAVTYL